MFVWTNHDSAIVKCNYSEKELVKAIGDYKFDKATTTWRFPIRKLIDIIDNLKIEYSEETTSVYNRLREERQAYHSKINKANEIKSTEKINWITALGSNKGLTDISKLYDHQKKAFILSSLFNSYALFMDPGTGKTLIAIKLIEHWKVPALIIAPLSTLESVWMEEIKKWKPLKSIAKSNEMSKLTVVNLWHNLKEFENNYDIFLINFEGFKKLVKTSKIQLDAKIGCIVIDESGKLKSYKSQITKEVLKFKDKIPHKLCLTGTPAPNNLLEYFSQMQFVNNDLLGDNFFRFRNTYFYSTGYGGYLYKPLKGAKETIIDKVSHQAFSIQKSDCLDLPPKTYETRTVYMDEAQENAYNQMKKENIMEFQGHTTLGVNELAKIMKLRQITSGWSITTQGIPVKISDSKINVLKELLEEIPEDKQVIIWVQFHFECLELKNILGDQSVMVSGLVSQKEKEKNIKDFQNNKVRVMIAHPKSGGHGLNLQQCSYSIWYSISYSYEEYTQACDRNYRIGTKNKVTYFHLLTKDSIDEVIYKALKTKQNLSEACLNMLKGING